MKELLQLMSECQSSCTNPLDSIYGLVGLASDKDGFNIRFDYTNSTAEQIFHAIVKSFVEQGEEEISHQTRGKGPLQFLSFCDNSNHGSECTFTFTLMVPRLVSTTWHGSYSARRRRLRYMSPISFLWFFWRSSEHRIDRTNA